MNQINKQHELTINISPQSRNNIITNTTFFSMDVKTAKKVINFTHENRPVNLTGATIMLGFEFVGVGKSKIVDSTDGSLTIENAEAGRCRVMLPNHIYNYEGQVLVHVYILFEDGRSLDCGVIVTEFEKSWLDTEVEAMSDFYVKRFEDLQVRLQMRVAELKDKIEPQIMQLQQEVDNVASHWADYNVPGHIHNEKIHLTQDERNLLFKETSTHQIADNTILKQTQGGQLANRNIKGRTRINLWSDDQSDFSQISNGTILGDTIRFASTGSTTGVTLKPTLFSPGTAYTFLIDVITLGAGNVFRTTGVNSANIIDTSTFQRVSEVGRHIFVATTRHSFENTNGLQIGIAREGYDPIGAEIKISIFEGDLSNSLLEHVPPRLPVSVGEGIDEFVISTQDDHGNHTSTTIEYQNGEGVWKKPVLRQGEGVFDEITETELIKRLDETLKLLPEEQRYPIRMRSLSTFPQETTISINSGMVKPTFSFDVVQNLPERLTHVERQIDSLQKLVSDLSDNLPAGGELL